jgi:hypothetical protein
MWDNPRQVLTLIDDHLARRPKMELRDVYKLLYQGVMGPEHLISSSEIFTARLQMEWDSLLPGPEESLFEIVRPDGSLKRLNLRPYRACGGKVEDLASACLRTAQRPWGKVAEVQSAWAIFTLICPQRYVHFVQFEVEAMTDWLDSKNYPALHHSDAYRQNYHPAYRLFASDDPPYY